MTGIFLQVRLSSSRLPGKALLKLEGQPVITHAMRALNRVKADVYGLLTSEESAPVLRIFAKQEKWELFSGPRDDVLARYVLAAREFAVTRIVRATGDNPLVSGHLANDTLDLAVETGSHYAGFTGIPIGTGVEVLEVDALEQAYAEAEDSHEREHVSPFLYRRPERFNIELRQAPEEICAPNIRVTLDTKEDYHYLRLLYAALYRNEPLELHEFVPWLKANPPHAD